MIRVPAALTPAHIASSVVGSTNVDLRSFRYNGECNLVIFDPATAACLAEQFERDLAAPLL